MDILYVLIPVSVALAAGFTAACVRAIRAGQFDDLESPRWRMLFEGNDGARREDCCGETTTKTNKGEPA